MTRLDSTPVDRDIGLRISMASRALAKHRAGRLRVRNLTPKGATALVLVDHWLRQSAQNRTFQF